MTTKPIEEAQERVDAAAKTVSEWRSNVGAIQSKIADAKTKVADYTARRREHSLAAALDRPDAAQTLARLHEDQAAAEMLAEDLFHALDRAKAHLAEAEAAKGAADLALSRELAKAVIKRRIAAAERFDRAAVELNSALSEFNSILKEMPDLGDIGGVNMSVVERRRGEHRVKDSLPQEVKETLKIAGILGVSGPCGSLAASEALVWRGVLG
jgi:hypothetical protein